MQSMISLMSMNHNDIAPLDDLEDIPDLESSCDISEHVIDFTQQLEQLTSSLNSPEDQMTSPSAACVNEEPTPGASGSNNDLEIKETSSPPASAVKTSDNIDATLPPKASLSHPEKPKLFEKQEKEQPKRTAGNLFHTFNFEDEKPAPLASPEQDRLLEKDIEPIKLVHKPPEVRKRIDLQPLNLRKSYDYETPKEMPQPEAERARTSTLGRDKTPGQDLLEWCKDVTKSYENVKITNLTTSFKNGMAFAAIIAHHRPDLIDLNSMVPSDIVGNCKKAFEAGEKLGIPRVIEPADMRYEIDESIFPNNLKKSKIFSQSSRNSGQACRLHLFVPASRSFYRTTT